MNSSLSGAFPKDAVSIAESVSIWSMHHELITLKFETEYADVTNVYRFVYLTGHLLHILALEYYTTYYTVDYKLCPKHWRERM